MASLSSKEYFSNLKQCCKEVDGLFMELNELLSGRRRGEPKGTLARLESEFSDLKVMFSLRRYPVNTIYL